MVLDGQGLLLSWMPQSQAYARVSLDAWGYLATARLEDNGLPAYYTYPEYDVATLAPYSWVHNPAGLFAMLTETGLRLYAFTGDGTVLSLVRKVLDYQLANGLTSPDALWAGVPYASSMPGALVYQGADDDWACGGCGSGDGVGVIEPDKVGELGYAYLRFHQATAQPQYLAEALACADALAANVRTGDLEHSPWPFRLWASDGTVREEYSANVIGPIRLFDELIRRGWGNTAAYARARDIAWTWMMAYPMVNQNWSGYFEDVPVMSDPSANRNQIIPLTTARYLMEHPELDPQWREHAASLLAFVEEVFGVDAPPEPGMQWGARTISEQEYVPVKMGSHTARYAATKALWSALAADPAAQDQAFRSFNWATYLSDGKGHTLVVDQTPDEGALSWFSDGYGDYIRHFLAGMEAVPEWAPPGESHLLGSSSVVAEIIYQSDQLAYRTFDPSGSEVLRLPRTPVAVQAAGESLPQGEQADGYSVRSLPGGDVVVVVRHSSASVVSVQLTATASPGALVAKLEATAPVATQAGGCSTAPATQGGPWLWLIVLLGLRAARGGARAAPAPCAARVAGTAAARERSGPG